jgi:tetratricopeptide (TPR) repeat protein
MPTKAFAEEGFRVTGSALEAVESFKSENYEEAYELFQVALEDFPDDLELRKYIANAIAIIAYRDYEEEDYYDSIDLFEEAIGLEDDVEFYKGLAMCHMKLDDVEAALETLLSYEDQSKLNSYLVDLYASLGEKLYQQGDVEGALENFLLSSELDSSNTHVLQRVADLKGEYDVEEGFHAKEGSHFIVKYDAGENAVMGNLVSILLEEAYMRIGYDFGHYPEDMIEAVLYTKEQFRDTTRSPSWTGALYDGRIKLPIGGINERTEELEDVLFHEYSHAVIHRVARGRAPMWLNEGIAQYVEGKRIEDDQDEYLKELLDGKELSLRSLEGSFMKLDNRQARNAYLMSLSATEYIIREFGSFTAMRVLEYLGEGESLNEAIQSAVHLSYDDLIESWLRSVRR